jgi:UDP-N-acetylmuramyl pentapeptide phosphotransferase/UDP-N-acetylglucosamine-1-phosphate transferase
MAYYLIRVVGIIFTLILLLALLLRPAQAGEVVTASISSNEQSGEPAMICLVIIIGTVLLAVWVWAEKMWSFIPS